MSWIPSTSIFVRETIALAPAIWNLHFRVAIFGTSLQRSIEMICRMFTQHHCMTLGQTSCPSACHRGVVCQEPQHQGRTVQNTVIIKGGGWFVSSVEGATGSMVVDCCEVKEQGVLGASSKRQCLDWCQLWLHHGLKTSNTNATKQAILAAQSSKEKHNSVFLTVNSDDLWAPLEWSL